MTNEYAQGYNAMYGVVGSTPNKVLLLQKCIVCHYYSYGPTQGTDYSGGIPDSGHNPVPIPMQDITGFQRFPFRNVRNIMIPRKSAETRSYFGARSRSGSAGNNILGMMNVCGDF